MIIKKNNNNNTNNRDSTRGGKRKEKKEGKIKEGDQTLGSTCIHVQLPLQT